MKKIFTLAAAATMVLAANAGTRVLYNQDFESVTSAADAGWTYGGASMEIASDEFGKFLQLNQGATNGRNAQVTWGTDIYGENASFLEDGIYTVAFDFSPKQSSNNQYNSGITILTNFAPPANQPFLGRWTYLKDAEGNNIEDMSLYQGYLLDLMQVQRETEDVNSIQFKVNGNDNDVIVLNNEWYTISATVNVNTRTVEYSIETLMGEVVTSGTRTVPATECNGEEINMYASGLWVMVARYQTQFLFDNIKVTTESTQDVANDPTVALTRIGKDAEGNLDLAHRAYTITFLEGEMLHVVGTDGKEEVISFFDCDGAYEYTTTTGGTLKAWTTAGNATSAVIEVEVDCTPVALPAADAVIMSVANGYGKTYKLNVDNANVPLQPQIFIDYKFVGETKTIEGNEESSGVTFTVTEAGTLTVTTKAFGYQATSITIQNDSKYTEKYTVDFARMSAADIAGYGFTKDEDLNSGTTSGEQNWTARKRLFYYDAATAAVDPESGETVYTAVYPFGFIAEDDTEHVLHRHIISADDLTEEKAAEVFPHVILWNGLQAKMLERVGLIQDATTKNYNPVKFTNFGPNDVLVVNTTNSYGADSCHPVCNNDAEYFAQLAGTDYAYAVANLSTTELGNKDAGAWKIDNEDGTFTVGFNLYRIDTALTKATVFTAGETGIEGVAIDTVITDNAWYTIDGLRLDAPNRSGIYIHNGKKVIIRK